VALAETSAWWPNLFSLTVQAPFDCPKVAYSWAWPAEALRHRGDFRGRFSEYGDIGVDAVHREDVFSWDADELGERTGPAGPHAL